MVSALLCDQFLLVGARSTKPAPDPAIAGVPGAAFEVVRSLVRNPLGGAEAHAAVFATDPTVVGVP